MCAWTKTIICQFGNKIIYACMFSIYVPLKVRREDADCIDEGVAVSVGVGASVCVYGLGVGLGVSLGVGLSVSLVSMV